MDSIITPEIVSDVIESIKDIDTLSPEEYKEAVDTLLDGEEALLNALQTPIMSRIIGDIQTHWPKDTKALPDELAIVISKSTTAALLIGFISERYSRDILSDDKTANSNEDFKRIYETVPMYIKRKLKAIKSEDLTSIALNEATKKEDES